VRLDHPNRLKTLGTAEFWQRRLPTVVAAAVTPYAVAVLGAAQVRAALNKAAGEVVYFTDKRIMTAHQNRLGIHGYILAPGGCEWAVKSHDGCTFCFYQGAVDSYVGKLPLSEREFNALFAAGFNTMRHTCDAICYFTAGSALNPGEIPPGTMRYIANSVARSKRPKMLRVESRAPWITAEAVRPIATTLRNVGKTFDIAIGFESQDDGVRNRLLNKGMTKKQFELAVTTARENGARVTAYIMLKGHWRLGEGYAIEECVRSIQYAFGIGVAEVQLQPLFICADGSIMERKFREGAVKPPWLWSIAEVFRRTLHMGPVILGPLDSEVPVPIALPKNCPACSPAFMERIVRWRMTLNPSVWTDQLPDCSCATDWACEVSRTQTSPSCDRGDQ
jgi:radical SAM enzyme (TIGR01210 family)